MVTRLRQRLARQRPSVPLLDVIDYFKSGCLAAIPDFSLSGLRVIREFEVIMTVRGNPVATVSNNSTELTRNAVLRWAADGGHRL